MVSQPNWNIHFPSIARTLKNHIKGKHQSVQPIIPKKSFQKGKMDPVKRTR